MLLRPSCPRTGPARPPAPHLGSSRARRRGRRWPATALYAVLVAVLGTALALGASPVASAATASSAGTASGVIGAGPAATSAGQGERTVPVYSYAKAIHESVRVATTMDSDGDGRPDTIAVDIIRPREPAEAGTKVPVIMDASPYFLCCGRGNQSQLKTYDSAGVIAAMPLYYDNYFVPRGYAEVGVDVLGTNRSTGCGDLGGPHEIAGITAVIDWLNGRSTATDLSGRKVTASWATGSVGMIGKSYDGSLANGVAATGVAGLKTIVPISAIDNWYFYTRSHGVVYYDNYPSYLTGAVGRTDGVCDAQRARLDVAADDASGDQNAFWQARNYLKNASRVRASVFESHGVNDTNVQTDNLSTWWAALGRYGVTRKLWLSQEGHVDPFDYRRSAWVAQLHLWFDHELMGLDNGVLDGPQVTVERSPNVFVGQASWPTSRPSTVVKLGRDGLGSTLGGTLALADKPSLTEERAVSTPSQPVAGRLMFTSAPLATSVRLSGTPTVTLRVSADRPDTPITAKLVDYGPSSRPVGEGVTNASTSSCWGESTAADSACYIDVRHLFAPSSASVLSRGWVDAAHARSSIDPTPLVPGKWRLITIPLRAQDVTLAKGHQLGVVISLSDTEYTTPNSTGATIAIDLTQSSLSLPLTSGVTITPGPVTGVVAPALQSQATRATPPLPMG